MSKYIEEDFQHNKTHHFVPKGWGYELWITNNHRYCGKLLKIIKGKKLSWHYHVIKDEVMFCQSGEVKITYGWDNDISRAQKAKVFIFQGNSFIELKLLKIQKFLNFPLNILMRILIE
jgi:mannose-6-phosphate isomerase-like protein (cupin superfamily)